MTKNYNKKIHYLKQDVKAKETDYYIWYVIKNISLHLQHHRLQRTFLLAAPTLFVEHFLLSAMIKFA
jgi:hypothetical protein